MYMAMILIATISAVGAIAVYLIVERVYRDEMSEEEYLYLKGDTSLNRLFKFQDFVLRIQFILSGLVFVAVFIGVTIVYGLVTK